MPNQSGQKAAATASYLNPDLKSPQAQDFEDKLSARIVGQERAADEAAGALPFFGHAWSQVKSDIFVNVLH